MFLGITVVGVGSLRLRLGRGLSLQVPGAEAGLRARVEAIPVRARVLSKTSLVIVCAQWLAVSPDQSRRL